MYVNQKSFKMLHVTCGLTTAVKTRHAH